MKAKLKKVIQKLNPKKYKEGYALIGIVAIFGILMLLIAISLTKTVISQNQRLELQIQSNSPNFTKDIARFVLSRNGQIKNGFYELGQTIDFTQEQHNEVKESIGIEIGELNNGWKYDSIIKYDYISSSIVPIPTAYNFSLTNQGPLLSGTNGLESFTNIKGPYNNQMLTPSTAGTVDLGFYLTNTPGAVCDPESNWQPRINSEQLNYNIFRRVGNTPESDWKTNFPTNYTCNGVVLKYKDFDPQFNPYRTGGQYYVDRGTTKDPEAVGTPNFYYTIPPLGMGSAGSSGSCGRHSVRFNTKWTNSDEFIDPLDDPCNWNRLEQGQAVQFGLSSFNPEEIAAQIPSANLEKAQSPVKTGEKLKEFSEQINQQSFYTPLDQNDTLILRIRLSCASQGTDCHPLERSEFYDRLLDESLAGKHIPHLDNTIYNHTFDPAYLLKNNNGTDFTPRVLDLFIIDKTNIFTLFNQFNRDDSISNLFKKDDKFNQSNSKILPGRILSSSEITYNLLRLSGHYLNINNRYFYPINSLNYIKRFTYDYTTKTSHINLNGLGFSNLGDQNLLNYKPIFAFNLSELENPEIQLKNLDGYITTFLRQKGFSDPYLTQNIEYQIVSSKPIGLDRAYVIAEEIHGKEQGRVFLERENEPTPNAGTVFSNISN